MPCRPLRVAGLLLTLAVPLSAQPPTPLRPPMTPEYPSEFEGKTLSQWMADLKHEDPGIREEAIRAVVVFGPAGPDLVSALIVRCKDGDASPRVRAVQALGILELQKKEDIPRVVEALALRVVNDSEHVVRFQAAASLSRYPEHLKPVIPSLVRGTEMGGCWDARRLCVILLAHAGRVEKGPADPRAVLALTNALIRENSVAVRLEAIQGLGYLGKTNDQPVQLRAENELQKLAAGRDRVLSIWALVTLMELDHPSEPIIQGIVKQLKAPEFRIRIQAARALGVIGPRARKAVPDLIDMLDDKEESAVQAACMALSYIGRTDRPNEVCAAAAAIPKLTDLLQDKNPNKAYAACIALANLGAAANPALPKLKALSESKDKEVPEELKEVAKWAMETIQKPPKPR
jgi:HEAT repeat protein